MWECWQFSHEFFLGVSAFSVAYSARRKHNQWMNPSMSTRQQIHLPTMMVPMCCPGICTVYQLTVFVCMRSSCTVYMGCLGYCLVPLRWMMTESLLNSNLLSALRWRNLWEGAVRRVRKIRAKARARKIRQAKAAKAMQKTRRKNRPKPRVTSQRLGRNLGHRQASTHQKHLRSLLWWMVWALPRLMGRGQPASVARPAHTLPKGGWMLGPLGCMKCWKDKFMDAPIAVAFSTAVACVGRQVSGEKRRSISAICSSSRSSSSNSMLTTCQQISPKSAPKQPRPKEKRKPAQPKVCRSELSCCGEQPGS